MNNPSFGADDPIETIIQRYADLVYKLAYAKTRHPHDAEDIFQEVFLRYIQKQPKFQSPDHEKAGLSG
ncbi:MAG: RNA polymerase sigma factor [Clostridia bacterium]